jgi:class 3 adenylate cyclase
MDLLRQVDDQILKDIGVSSAGHRLRIRNAIAKLGPEATHGKEGAATGATIANVEVRQPTLSTAAGATPVSAAAEVAGERRYLTVMFCDLVGSTGISAQLDAEEWRDLIGSYLDVACAAVTEMGVFALLNGSFTHILCGNYAAVSAEAGELAALADARSGGERSLAGAAP